MHKVRLRVVGPQPDAIWPYFTSCLLRGGAPANLRSFLAPPILKGLLGSL